MVNKNQNINILDLIFDLYKSKMLILSLIFTMSLMILIFLVQPWKNAKNYSYIAILAVQQSKESILLNHRPIVDQMFLNIRDFNNSVYRQLQDERVNKFELYKSIVNTALVKDVGSTKQLRFNLNIDKVSSPNIELKPTYFKSYMDKYFLAIMDQIREDNINNVYLEEKLFMSKIHTMSYKQLIQANHKLDVYKKNYIISKKIGLDKVDISLLDIYEYNRLFDLLDVEDDQQYLLGSLVISEKIKFLEENIALKETFKNQGVDINDVNDNIFNSIIPANEIIMIRNELENIKSKKTILESYKKNRPYFESKLIEKNNRDSLSYLTIILSFLISTFAVIILMLSYNFIRFEYNNYNKKN